MWPFQKAEKPAVTAPPALEERCAALERRNSELAADLALLRREWADTLDKLQTWFGRQAARRRQQLHRDLLSEGEKEAEEAPQAPIGPQPMDKGTLRRIAAQRRLGGQR